MSTITHSGPETRLRDQLVRQRPERGPIKHAVLDLRSAASLAPLTGATSIESLSLYGGPVPPLSPLAALHSLRSLDLEGCTSAPDLSPLDALPRLAELSLPERVHSLDPLEGMPALRSLSLCQSDVASLAGLSLSLDALALRSGALDSLPDLSNTGRLRKLTLCAQGSRVSDLGPLACLDSLETLALPSAQIEDLRPLARLVRLKDLDLHNNRTLRSLEGLEDLPALDILNLNHTEVEALGPLGAMVHLKELRLRRTQVRTIHPLLGCAALERLYLEKSRLASIEGIGALGSLRALWFWGTQVQDLSPLSGMTWLEELNIADLPQPLRGAEALSTLSGLQALDLRHTGLPLDQLAAPPGALVRR